MASKVQIANRAATKLGAQRIISLTDNTTVASTLNSMFDLVLDAELRRYRWSFAIKRDSLAALAGAPGWGYMYRYQLPVDLLHLIQVNDFYFRGTKQQTPWTIEGRELLTNIAAPLKVRYVRRITDTTLLDPLFVEVFSCKLAMESAEALTQSPQKRQLAQQEYEFAVKEAIRQNAIELPPDQLPWGSWLDSRESQDSYIATSGESYPYLSGFEVL
jgi:hypothetical protein